MTVDELLQPGLDFLAVAAGRLVACQHGGARFHQRCTGLQLADGSVVPDDLPVTAQFQCGIGGGSDRLGPGHDLG